jgi:adenylate cyclase
LGAVVAESADKLGTLNSYLANLADFLEQEKAALEALQEAWQRKDESHAHKQAMDQAFKRVTPMVEATRRVGDWLPRLQDSLNKLVADLDAQTRRHDQLMALYDVSQVVNSTLDLEELLNLVMDLIIEVTRAERGFLMLMDEGTGDLAFKVARNMDRETITGPAFEISRSIVNQVSEKGIPVLTTNAQDDPRFRSQASVVSYSLRSILCVPLTVKDKVTGVIHVDNRIKTGLFSEEDRDLLVAFANQAAIAIENARLFENVRQKMDEIATMKNYMDNIFASIASGVVTTDVKGRVTTLNQAAEGILGVSAVQAIGRPYREVLTFSEDTLLPYLVDRVRTGEGQYIGLEVEPQLPGKGKVNLSLNLSALKDADQGTLGVAIVLDDLTEKRRLEEEREREEREKKRIRRVLERYVHPAVVERLLSNPEELRLGGTRRELTILFGDIKGFTSFAEKMPPEMLVETLNQYLGISAMAVLEQGGMLDKFLGDAVMGLFNWPEFQQDHALRAVKAALNMMRGITAYHQHRETGALLSFKVGINVGEAVVGNIGIPQRSDYTAIGDSVNLAKGLQEHAEPGQILLSQSAYERVRYLVEAIPLEPVQVKGRSTLEKVYELKELKVS